MATKSPSTTIEYGDVVVVVSSKEVRLDALQW